MLRQKNWKYLGIVFIAYLGFVCLYDKYIFESVLLMDSLVGSAINLKDNPDYEKVYNMKMLLEQHEAKNNSETKVILIWTPMFRRVHLAPYICDGCIFTHDQSAIEIADAVIFHCVETRDDTSWLPWKHRKPEQRWIWACMEPPWNVRYVFQKTLTPLNGAFNWTMTYRTDSDILMSYISNIKELNKSVSDIIQDKNASALGAWIVSNCHANERSQLISELSKYVKIDVFGKCSNVPLCRGDCERDVLYRYKFYFALENSRCKDYISEKFWYNGLSSYTVPVVLGPSRRDYEIVAPPNSFIHVDDFDSVESLAKYLMKLDKDDKLYGEYLRWMSEGEKTLDWAKDISNLEPAESYSGLIHFKTTADNDYCAVCNKLKKPLTSKVVVELDTWWYGENYSSRSEKFSICSPKSGKSGYPRRWQVSLGYNLFALLFFCCVLCCWKKRMQ